jgi:hypothetical protein
MASDCGGTYADLAEGPILSRMREQFLIARNYLFLG